MKEIDKADLATFLEKFKVSEPSKNYNDKKTLEAINGALHASSFDHSMTVLMTSKLMESGPMVAALSVWMTGFQMGREFEHCKAEVADLNRLWADYPPTLENGITPKAKTTPASAKKSRAKKPHA